MSTQTNATAPSVGPMVERHSIDYVPRNERFGRPLNQFTLWFGANLQITAVVTGALAVVLGGDVVWSIVGLLIGQLLGGVVMALHSVQGPRRDPCAIPRTESIGRPGRQHSPEGDKRVLDAAPEGREGDVLKGAVWGTTHDSLSAKKYASKCD